VEASWFSASRFDQSPGHHLGLGKQGFVTAFDLDQVKFPKVLRHAQKRAGGKRGITLAKHYRAGYGQPVKGRGV
jgi:hypothetical protein